MSKSKTLLVTECPNCKTEYRYESIEELKLVKGYFNKVYSELGTGIEVWVKFVKCQCGKLFVPTLKRMDKVEEVEQPMSISRSTSPEKDSKREEEAKKEDKEIKE